MRRVRAVLQGAPAVLMAAMIAACTQAPAPLSPIIAPPTHTIAQLVNHKPPLFGAKVRVEGYLIVRPIGLLCPVLPDNPPRVEVGECLSVFWREEDLKPARKLHRRWVRIGGTFDADTCPPDEIMCLVHPHPSYVAEREKVFGEGTRTFSNELIVDAMERVVPPR